MIHIIPKIVITINPSFKTKCLNLFKSQSLTFYRARVNTNNDLEIVANYFSKSKFEKILIENEIPYKLKIIKTPITFIINHIYRFGFILGGLLLIAFTMISSRFVWKIEIIGNYSTSEKEIINSLEDVGFSLGSYIPNINYNALHNKFLMKEKRISWISINIKGNVATVMVREKESEYKSEKINYTNVVAKYDGQIQLINVIEGKKQIIIGDVVKKGDLLISGVLNSQSQGVRYVNAKGSVYAYVNKEILIKVPIEHKEKHYKNDSIIETKYTFFKNNINLYKNNNKKYELYDIIEKSEYVYIFDKIKLPIQKTIKKYYPYEYENSIYSKNEALEVAMNKLNYEIENISKNAEIVSKNIKTSFENNEIIVKCNCYCIEDIAQCVEFFVTTK